MRPPRGNATIVHQQFFLRSGHRGEFEKAGVTQTRADQIRYLAGTLLQFGNE